MEEFGEGIRKLGVTGVCLRLIAEDGYSKVSSEGTKRLYIRVCVCERAVSKPYRAVFDDKNRFSYACYEKLISKAVEGPHNVGHGRCIDPAVLNYSNTYAEVPNYRIQHTVGYTLAPVHVVCM